MHFALFYQSLISDWSNGSAHFLRGIATELLQQGHEVSIYEPKNGWSRENLLQLHGKDPIRRFRTVYPTLSSHVFDVETIDLDLEMAGVDVAIVHAWNDPVLIERLGEHHGSAGGYCLLYHGAQHRFHQSENRKIDLSHYDGLLAPGSAVRDLSVRNGWIERAWTWHEAADIRVFRPRFHGPPCYDLVWVGNWLGNERDDLFRDFFIAPAEKLRLRAVVHGAGYPPEMAKEFAASHVEFRGWIPNFAVPTVFAEAKATIHIPRRPMRSAPPGIPSIRIFEAMACGTPLICAPWEDVDELFRAGEDYLVARDPAHMERLLKNVLHDQGLANFLAAKGLSHILERHTCAHRVRELFGILRDIGIDGAPPAPREEIQVEHEDSMFL